MTHRFPIKEIALQAGLSTATVDRALNNRAHVSPQTQRRVQAALSELEGQEQQLSAIGRRMFIDIVVEAPTRFSKEIRTACEAVLPTLSGAVFRPRFVFSEVMSEEKTLSILYRIAKRGSHGVCLKVRDLPSIREAVDKLIQKNIPVVTLFTDIREVKRQAYIGLNNIKAGRTAAYLMTNMLANQTGTILTLTSQTSFVGEDDRRKGFMEYIKQNNPQLTLANITGAGGLFDETAKQVSLVAPATSNILGVYSMSGGNRAILKILEEHGHKPSVFVAHDLDEENTQLLNQRAITYVLHHELKNDMRNALLTIAIYQRLLPELNLQTMADVQIITPENKVGTSI
jgi:LacI family transcriptional regulator